MGDSSAVQNRINLCFDIKYDKGFYLLALVWMIRGGSLEMVHAFVSPLFSSDIVANPSNILLWNFGNLQFVQMVRI